MSGKQVVLMGWVAKKRDFGVLTFIDLRDREGLTQVVVERRRLRGDAHSKAKNLRGEFVIAVKGEVVRVAKGRITQNSRPAISRSMPSEILDPERRQSAAVSARGCGLAKISRTNRRV